MEKMLLKMARQLESMDEASLMALWSKYATLTSRFEPTKRWEENCLVFSLIQAVRWKNQLFNYSWSQQRRPPLREMPDAPDIASDFTLEKPAKMDMKQGCRVLSFKTGMEERKETSGKESEPEKE